MEKRLEKWSLVLPSDPYLPPEMASYRMRGEVYNDPGRPDGRRIKTSMVVGKAGDLVRTYSGSLYRLGEVDPEYEKQFPNARDRLFSTLPELG